MFKTSVPQIPVIDTPVDPNVEPGQTVMIVFATPNIIPSLPACLAYDIEEDESSFSRIHGV